MTFAVALLLALGSYGEPVPVSQSVSASAASYDVDSLKNVNAAPHRDQQSNEGSCSALVQRLCAVATEDMCRTLEREYARRSLTDREETECRNLLDDRDRLEEILRRLRSQRP